MNNFSKLYLLSPESYNKLVLDKMVHPGIDREMYNILNMKKITDAKKWYLYRDLLHKFANRARNNKTVNDKPLNAIEPSLSELLLKNRDKKNSPLKYSVQSQTNIVRRARIDQNNQTEKNQNEMSIQTDPIMDETIYELNPEDSFYDANDREAGQNGWTYENSMPGFAQFEIEKEISPKRRSSSTPRKSKSPRKSLNKSGSPSVEYISPTHADVAKTILNKGKKPTLRRALTYSGEKEKQMQLNFPILKNAPLTRAAAKAQNVQTGNNCFKWSCVK